MTATRDHFSGYTKGPWRISHTPGVRIALKKGYADAPGFPRLYSRVRI